MGHSFLTKRQKEVRGKGNERGEGLGDGEGRQHLSKDTQLVSSGVGLQIQACVLNTYGTEAALAWGGGSARECV